MKDVARISLQNDCVFEQACCGLKLAGSHHKNTQNPKLRLIFRSLRGRSDVV
jgi:hypothetical protein